MSEKKVAIITGGSRGIGRATAVEMAKTGYYVVINYQANENAAKETLQQVRAAGLTVTAVLSDSGYGDATYDGRSATISGSNYKYVTGGSLGFRFPQADPYLNPGDALTVTDTDDVFTIDQITYAISARGAKFMEVREA